MIGQPRLHRPACPSTQAILIEHAAELPDGAIATTDHQTAGRGRLGRTWEDAPGTSVLCSVLLHPPPARPAPELSLIAAVSVAEALETVAGIAASIKWPNDIVIEERKVAGILAEMREDAVVVGIGVNVNQTAAQLPSSTRRPAGSLHSITGVLFDREEVLATLLARFDARYEEWRAEGLEAAYGALAARNYLFGRPLHVGDVAGTGGAIARDGRLEIMTAAGPMLVESGEVVLER